MKSMTRLSRRLGAHALLIGMGLMLVNCGPAITLDATKWSSDCGGRGSTRETHTFTETQLSIDVDYFNVSDRKTTCATHDLKVTYVFDYVVGDELGGMVGGMKGVRKIDLKLKSINILAITDGGKSTAKKNCPGPDFAVGTSMNILPKDDAKAATCDYVVSTPVSGTYINAGEGSLRKLEAETFVAQIYATEEFENGQGVLWWGAVSSTGSDSYGEGNRPYSLQTNTGLALKKRAIN